MKKLLLALPLTLFLAACGNNATTDPQEIFETAVTPQTLPGIWYTWNEDGNFEFFDFMTNVLVQAYIRPENESVGFIRVGGFHFHGADAHAHFNVGLFEDGAFVQIHDDFYFEPRLNGDGSRLRVEASTTGEVWYLNYLGNDPHELVHQVGHGVYFFESLELDDLLDIAWAQATITGDDFD